MADIPADITTTATFEGDPLTGATFGGDLETAFDIDVVKVSLIAGTSYGFYGSMDTTGPSGGRAVLNLLDASGIPIIGDLGLPGLDGTIHFTPLVSGTYFVQVSEAFGNTGSYTLGVANGLTADIHLGANDDTFAGTVVNQRILGDYGNDFIHIGAGLDALGDQGNDVLIGNSFSNFISGGTGGDLIDGADGTDSLFGDAGDDNIFGGAGADRIYGGTGDDTLFGGNGGNALGDTANNQIHGGDDADFIVGNAGLDALWGDDGADLLIGLGQADRLDGGAGADSMFGGGGNDSYVVDDDGDIVDESVLGGDGVDTVLSSISFSLSDATHAFGDIERLILTGSADLDGTGNALANFLVGNSGGNVLSGLDGIDNLFGRAGNDHLVGGDGNDALNGGDGADELIGGVGRDRLTGGAGADIFVFASTAESNLSGTGRDVILDFSSAEGDKIDLTAIDADSVTAGAQHFSFIGTAQFTHQAGELRYGVRSGNVYVYGDTDSDGHVDFSVLLNGVASIQAGDFVL